MTEKIKTTSIKRESFLDILRVAATCVVVLLHTLTGAVDAVDIRQYQVERTVFLVMMDMITWCVPVFVLISGYLFLNPLRKISFFQMLKKYCRRILLALFIFGVPYAVLEQILRERTFRVSMLGQGFLNVLRGESWSHMWYLYMILLLYFLTPALKWLLVRLPKACVYALLAALFVFSSLLPFLNKLLGMELPVLPDGGIYFFYYICGYLFACNSLQEKEHLPACRGKLFGIFILLLGMALSRIVWDFSVQMAYNYPFIVFLSLLIFSVGMGKKVQLAQETASVWGRLGEMCFAVYLVHPVFINFVYKFLDISLLDFPIGLSLPIFFVGILLLAVIAAGVLCKIPILKKYVL